MEFNFNSVRVLADSDVNNLDSFGLSNNEKMVLIRSEGLGGTPTENLEDIIVLSPITGTASGIEAKRKIYTTAINKIMTSPPHLLDSDYFRSSLLRCGSAGKK